MLHQGCQLAGQSNQGADLESFTLNCWPLLFRSTLFANNILKQLHPVL